MPPNTKEVVATWSQGLKFDAKAGSGHRVRIDGRAAAGFSPMELVLVGLAGCTGADVIDILRKKRQTVTGFEVRVRGERAEAHPRKYTSIHVTYVVTGHRVDPEAVRRSIELSQTKYCSVSATLQPTARITTSFEISADERAPV